MRTTEHWAPDDLFLICGNVKPLGALMDKVSPLEEMVRHFTSLLDAGDLAEQEKVKAGGNLLAKLVSRDDWLPEPFTRPHPRHYQQYLLYCDPLERFSVVSFVWGPGQTTPVHDHTVWGIIGILRGAEISRQFNLKGSGAPMDCLGEKRFDAGCIDYVSPAIGDIHQVSNAYDDRVSISIHMYGANIGGVTRHVYDTRTGMKRKFVSGYVNVPADQIPVWHERDPQSSS
jgi:predicted metal-dependent enzyme (double-stranded beta helix superfamily)